MPFDAPPATLPVTAAVLALAMVGDLSMGQPIDQSLRAARLAQQIAALASPGSSPAIGVHARLVSLLRWSGCTANAAGFATLLGDDVSGRDAMLRHALPSGHPLNFTNVEPLARIHCEVAGDVAGMLGLPREVESGLRCVWEYFDGSGAPHGLRAEAIPEVVYFTSVAGDLEILARSYDLASAVRMIRGWGGVRYPAALAALVAEHAEDLLAGLDEAEAAEMADAHPLLAHAVPLTIVADLLELKLPWLAGYSRRVADLAGLAAIQAGLPVEQQQRLARAALIHGIGRASVPNTVWERNDKLSSADWERIRLVPYWTSRCAALIPVLRDEAALASHIYERLDGSGYFRSLDKDTLGLPQRLLAVAAAHVALCSPRPWRAPMSLAQAAQQLAQDAECGLFDREAVAWVNAAANGDTTVAAVRRSAPSGPLSERELEVLRRISLGESNKEAARVMQISPSTVRTHVESIFRKLACSTRASATLKALTMGLI